MDPPLVSIIINNYNYDRFLHEAVDSALLQTYPHIEVIVVDDGSTDNSLDIIKSYGDRIIPLFKANGGQASAFNAGFAACQGEIICFLDSDDLFLPQKVAEIVSVFEAHQDIGWCYHAVQLFDNYTQAIIPCHNRWFGGKWDLRAFIAKGKLHKYRYSFPPTSGLCYRRSLIEQILPMPEAIQITSDNFLKFIAVALSQGFVLTKELAIQRIHGDNAYTFRKDKQRVNAKIHVLTAYWMRLKFPSINKFANNLFAIGLGTYWRIGGVEDEHQEVVKSYLSSVLLLERLEINLRAIYYLLKL